MLIITLTQVSRIVLGICTVHPQAALDLFGQGKKQISEILHKVIIRGVSRGKLSSGRSRGTGVPGGQDPPPPPLYDKL